jgi:hypothetical protein
MNIHRKGAKDAKKKHKNLSQNAFATDHASLIPSLLPEGEGFEPLSRRERGWGEGF